MDQDFLQQFRHQLATWIEQHLATQRLPFQRLEICPSLMTELGRLVPDMVLWINRDSQLAGSMILLPSVVDKKVLAKAVAMARALGLGHFTTWEARNISIWKVESARAEIIQKFTLPPASQVQPEDFELTLERLLDQLKVVAVTSAPLSDEFTLYYYVNLCLRNLQELSPGLTASARLTAGQTAADKWVELAPAQKAWLSLWRVLYLLWQKRMPPGLQPDRLEQVFHYALADFNGNRETLDWLAISAAEPPLADADAIRLHHLAGRLSQLGWPEKTGHATALIDSLLAEVAQRFNLASPPPLWSTEDTTLWINTRPPQDLGNSALVATRAYIAGAALKSLISECPGLTLADDLQSLSDPKQFTHSVAAFLDTQIPDRNDRDARLVTLRKAWPNRRFELPLKTPLWLWDALYLAGIASNSVTLALPENWSNAPGAAILWEAILDCFHLSDISVYEGGTQILRLRRTSGSAHPTTVHRHDMTFEIQPGLTQIMPGTIRFWLNAEPGIIDYLRSRNMAGSDLQWSDSIQWGTYIFLQTRLGRYIWSLCSNKSDTPEPDQTEEAVLAYGLPLPDVETLMDLSFSGSRIDREIPSSEILEHEFSNIYGPCPHIPASVHHDIQEKTKAQRKNRIVIEQVTAKVFLDGVPRFPEHYLMDTFKPELEHYNFDGPLELSQEFFDRISLRTASGEMSIEVSGRTLAEALIIASWSGQTSIDLPKDHALLEKILHNYRNDLNHLWDKLTRECRRVDPYRQSAIRMAKRIWLQQGLPPENHF